MKWSAAVLLFAVSVAQAACKPGWKPESSGSGVCEQVQDDQGDGSQWRSNEKPPDDKMPSWQREGIKVVDALKNCTADDERADMEKAESIAAGKRAAGIK